MSTNKNSINITSLNIDLQVNILTYLRAYDLSAVQQTCRFYANPDLIHVIVTHTAEVVYPRELTRGFETSVPVKEKGADLRYTYEHLRAMEWLVIARVLNSPEPPTGYIVSKSWCKMALKWLDSQETAKANNNKKRQSKKQERMRRRKLSDASPPWPNVNSDLLCTHQNLSYCTNRKSSRARRRLIDKQAWKILKKLYPDSTQLESHVGECLQCSLEIETSKRNALAKEEQEKIQRKRILENTDVRRFYTRKTGVPHHALWESPTAKCPLIPGKYHMVPRQWCYDWRRFIKTGEGGPCTPPDAASLLCHAHRLLLLPPHLESYLYAETTSLWGIGIEEPATPRSTTHVVPGQPPDEGAIEALRAAGLSENELSAQWSAMRNLETDNTAAPLGVVLSPSKNEWLDRENHAVVEILTSDEFTALEHSWSTPSFALTFDVASSQAVTWSVPVCRDCDATGKSSSVRLKSRSRASVRRTPDRPHLEY